MSQSVPPKKRLPIVQLAIVGVVALAAVILVLRGVDLRSLMDQGIVIIRDLGPVVFFAVMAVLPAFGAPMMIFTMTAGQAFEPQLGLAGVIAISLAVVGLNLALGYWVARYALRPVLVGLIKRYGYTVPRVTKENALAVTMLVRLTPGPPYAFQACILGLAEVPFRMYLIVSWLAMVPWTVGAIVLGKGIFSGKFGMVVSGIGVLIVAVVAVQLIRRKLARRRQELTPAEEKV